MAKKSKKSKQSKSEEIYVKKRKSDQIYEKVVKLGAIIGAILAINKGVELYDKYVINKNNQAVTIKSNVKSIQDLNDNLKIIEKNKLKQDKRIRKKFNQLNKSIVNVKGAVENVDMKLNQLILHYTKCNDKTKPERQLSSKLTRNPNI